METTTEVAIIENTPQQLLTLAINKGVDVAQLEKLMELQERWEAKESRKTFLAAISKFQSEVPVLEKKKLVSFGTTKYKYAELGEITQTIKRALADNGLSYRWEFEENAEKTVCTCIISHVSGHSEKTGMSAANDKSGGKNDIQSKASSMTYMQRYTLIGALGLSTANEDNDAQSEQPKEPVKTSQPSNGKVTPNVAAEAPKPTKKYISDKAFEDAKVRINNGDIALFPKLIEGFGMKKEQEVTLRQLHEFSLTLSNGTDTGVLSDEEKRKVEHSLLLCETGEELEAEYKLHTDYHSYVWYNDMFNSIKSKLLNSKTKNK